MNKKELRKVSMPCFYDDMKAKIKDKIKYVYTANVENGLLVVNVFDKDGIIYRLFAQGNEDICLDLRNNKWRSGINNLYLNEYTHNWRTSNITANSNLDRYVIRSFANLMGTKSGLYAFDYIHTRNNDRKRTAKKNAKQKRIDNDMEKLSELPDLVEYSNNVILKNDNYIFLFKEDNHAHCSYCDSDITYARDYKHLKKGMCPVCKETFTCRSIKISTRSLEHKRYSVHLENIDGMLIARYVGHSISFDENGKARRSIGECYREFMYGHSIERYSPTWVSKLSGIEMHWTKWKRPCVYWWQNPSEWNEPKNVVVYDSLEKINEILKGTDYQYSALGEWLMRHNGTQDEYPIANYISYYNQQPALEKLVKVGFWKLAYHFINHKGLADKPNIKDILKVNGNGYKLLQGIGDPKIEDLQLIHNDMYISENDFALAREMVAFNKSATPKKVIEIKKYSTLHKALRYMKENNITNNDWFDHIECLKNLEMELNEFNIYPKKFREVKQKCIDKLNVKRDEEKRRQMAAYDAIIEEIASKCSGKIENLEYNGIIVRMARSSKELIEEGNALHHCVGGDNYVKMVAEGKTKIFLIRKKDNPSESFYTLEWKNNKLIQCRTKRNKSYDEDTDNKDIKPFVETFVKLMQREEKRKKEVA